MRHFVNADGIIALRWGHGKGRGIRVLLTDTAVVSHSDFCELALFHCNGLFLCIRHYIRGLRMQDVIPRLERNLEPSLFICLDLRDSFSPEAVYCQNSLVRLIWASLSFAYHRAGRTDENLSFNAAVDWCRGCCGTGSQEKQ